MKISGFGYTVEIDSHGLYSIAHEASGISLSGAQIEYDTLKHGTVVHANLSAESVDEHKDGAAIKFRSPHGDSRLKISLEKDGVFIRLGVTHPGPMGRIVPLAMQLGNRGTGNLGTRNKYMSPDFLSPDFPNMHALRFMRPGYQSWSPAGSWSVTKKEPIPFLKMIRHGGFNPDMSFKPRAGNYHTDYATVLTDPETGKSMLIGFVTANKYLPSMNMELIADPLGATDRLNVRALCDAENAEVKGENIERESEILMVAFGNDPHELWERYLDVAARHMNARVKQEVPVGWCSWYHYFAMISEKTVRSNLAEMAKRKDELGVSVFQIDDGYCVTGDWLEWNDKFPSGPQAVARDIAAAGFIPGLWVAPFICSRGSDLFRNHKDWMLRNEKGKPLLVGLNPWWKGKAFYALDLTNPEALEHVGRVMKQVKDWGYNYVKIDFVFAALLRGRRHDPTKTGLEAYRAGLDVIRKTLGDDIFLLGCGAPMLPSVGMVDGMRVSADTAQYWRSKISRTLTRAPFDPAAENAIHGTVVRSAMHRRWWINDPDCLLVRKAKSLLTIDEIRTLATAIFLSGGMILMSDDMRVLDTDRWEIIRACTPPLGIPARPLDLFGKDDPELYHLRLPEGKIGDMYSLRVPNFSANVKEDRHLLGIINWKDRSQTPIIDPQKLGIKGPHHAFEFWSEKYIGIIDTDPKPLPFSLKPHGVALINLVAATGIPRVIGHTLHLGMGVISEKIAGNKMTVSLALQGPRKGKIFIAQPDGAVISKEVSFTDKTEVEVSLK